MLLLRGINFAFSTDWIKFNANPKNCAYKKFANIIMV